MTEKINVLHLRDTFEIGGPGKTILETFSHIDRNRFEIHIGVFKTRSEDALSPFIKEARRRGIPLHLIESSHQYSPAVILSLLRVMKGMKCDILHTHETKSDLLGLIASRIRRVPVVTTLHGWIGNTRKERFMIALDKMVVRGFDRVIAVSKGMKASLVEAGFDSSRVCLLHNCIVTGKYRNTGQKGYLSEKTGKTLKRPVIGSVGRLSREKGHKDFIEAISIVLGRGYDADFVLIGDGPERENLAASIDRLGLDRNVHFAGYLSDMQLVFQDLDLMVLPSHTEGLPNVVLESLMMGVPVIATDVGGTSDIISDYESGVLVAPGRPDLLACKIVEFLEDAGRFRRMSEKGRTAVETNFNFAARTVRLERIYEELASKKGR